MPSKTTSNSASTPTAVPTGTAKPALRWPALATPAFRPAPSVLLADQILTLPLLTPACCTNLIGFLSTLPLVTTGRPKRGEAVRVNDRFETQDWSFAQELWRVLQTGLLDGALDDRLDGGGGAWDWGGEVLGLNPRVRVYRYGKGMFFGAHYDNSDHLVLPLDPPTPAKTTWTLLVYLTGPADGLVGGETTFYPEEPMIKKRKSKSNPTMAPIVVAPRQGMALLHKHGSDCLLHEGREVTAGEKWVIRTDICVRR